MPDQSSIPTPTVAPDAATPSPDGGATDAATPSPDGGATDAAKTPPWGEDKNFTPEKAWELIQNLRREKGGAADELKAQLDTLTAQQDAQKKAFAEALGLTEPPKNEDELAETVRQIQEQLAASQRDATRLRIAAEHSVPAEFHHLLTETDPEKLKAQAETVAALVAAKTDAAAQPPAFQPNPGQGQGGGAPSEQALADAEYERYYPTPKR